MKKILYICCIFFSLNSFAQTNYLYGKWYLEKIDINNTIIFTPDDLQSTIFIYEIVAPLDKLIIDCCSGASTEIIHDDLSNSFVIDQSLFFSEFCFNINMGNFEQLYFSDFFELQNHTSTYTYTVSQQGSLNFLVITNTSTGDQAFYQSQQLGVVSKEKVAIQLYPNPVTNSFELEIDSGKEINSISVFSINGKEVLSFKKAQAIYDISQLAKGVYFVEIEIEGGKSIKKIVKQ
ncbi:T9SS type A sorting domain-containing protein [Mesonia sediminis]|uniref:T9SS type A sorting domain-containing protein n=1 Tax=Mesonia sediminis TaxID=1703946 RepID=A0ABW5SF47_9FLAO